MITAAVRPLLASGAAVVAAGALVVAPAPRPAAPPAPTVHVEQVALAGIGQDIYYAITPVVQYAVGGVSYLINFIPLIGAPIAAQVNINYFQAVQPVIEATVNYLAAVVQNPLDIIGATAAYGGTLYDIGYNWVSAELVFLGLPPLPPLPQIAAADRVGEKAGRGAAAAAMNSRAESTPDVVTDVPADAPADPAADAPIDLMTDTTSAADLPTGAPDRGRAGRPVGADARRSSRTVAPAHALEPAQREAPAVSSGERKRARTGE